MTIPHDIKLEEKKLQDKKLHESKMGKSFGVAPSPFNTVKLELGIVIVVSALLLISVDLITQDTLIQIGLLFMTGVSAMAWIIWRTHKVLTRQKNVSPEHDAK